MVVVEFRSMTFAKLQKTGRRRKMWALPTCMSEGREYVWMDELVCSWNWDVVKKDRPGRESTTTAEKKTVVVLPREISWILHGR